MKGLNRAILTILAVLHVVMSFAAVTASPITELAEALRINESSEKHFSKSFDGSISLNPFFENSFEEESETEDEASPSDDCLFPSALILRRHQRCTFVAEKYTVALRSASTPIYLLLENFRL
ncbi:MAG: hypothetical protein HWD92_05850 [Flavobacteriia bacterium]|nr:hypothetical protein [Flavobacteriia bacterium]